MRNAGHLIGRLRHLLAVVIDAADDGGQIGEHGVEAALQDADLVEGAVFHGVGQIPLLNLCKGPA